MVFAQFLSGQMSQKISTYFSFPIARIIKTQIKKKKEKKHNKIVW